MILSVARPRTFQATTRKMRSVEWIPDPSWIREFLWSKICFISPFFFVLFFNKKTFFCLYFWNETNVKCTVQNNFPLIWRDRKSELVYLPRDMRTWQIYFFCSSFYFIFMLEYVWVDPFIPLFTHFLLFSYVLIHEYYISFYWFSDTQGRIFPLN